MIRAVLLLPLAALALTAATLQSDDPLTRPIPDGDRWTVPAVPIRVFGNFYLVGFENVNVGLIDTGAGLILIDGAVPQGVHAIEANLRTLGFRIEDVKYILSTEPHSDHAGGLAALARDSGATVIAGGAALETLRGKMDASDAQAAWLGPFPAVTRLRGVRDGATLRLGNVTVTARATPGHTRGSTSWTWRSCERRDCKTIVFASSLTAMAAPGYRFSDHPEVVARFRTSFARLRTLPCDVLVTAHPGQSDGDAKRDALAARPASNPFVDPGACRTLARSAAQALDATLTKERRAP